MAWRQETPRSAIARVSQNDETLTKLNLSNNALFQMRPDEVSEERILGLLNPAPVCGVLAV